MKNGMKNFIKEKSIIYKEALSWMIKIGLILFLNFLNGLNGVIMKLAKNQNFHPFIFASYRCYLYTTNFAFSCDIRRISKT
jgi:hypothetical protein